MLVIGLQAGEKTKKAALESALENTRKYAPLTRPPISDVLRVIPEALIKGSTRQN